MKDFNTFLEENMSTINRYCTYYAYKFNIDKDELKSNVFERLCKHQDTFTEQNGTKSWLGTVIKNCCIDNTRKPHNRQYFYSLDIVSSTISDISSKVDRRNYIANIYVKIRKQYPGERYYKHRISIYMFSQGYRLKEISSHLNTTENSVKTLIYRIREFLHNGETVNI